jgi:hypothetical protein
LRIDCDCGFRIQSKRNPSAILTHVLRFYNEPAKTRPGRGDDDSVLADCGGIEANAVTQIVYVDLQAAGEPATRRLCSTGRFVGQRRCDDGRGDAFAGRDAAVHRLSDRHPVATAKVAAKERMMGGCRRRVGDRGRREPDCREGTRVGGMHALHNRNPNPKFIVKSIYEHASFQMDDASVVGPTSVEQVAALVQRCEAATGRPFFAEEYIEGREFNLALWGIEPDVLPPAEIEFTDFPDGKPRIVGHRAKWHADSFEYDQTERR